MFVYKGVLCVNNWILLNSLSEIFFFGASA